MTRLGDEFRMHDGIEWTVYEPSGRAWCIVWQPGRPDSHVRAWPWPAGRTAYRADATTEEQARAKAEIMAELIATLPPRRR
ncbi:hypothetical protein ACIBG8_54545 [Nonomuraea sp. NPDC050556]|uniref:hypothetical protein n=1 Tax=Nonomuraea sp. NPDC050556 TaxID=3364369 RepID=UPI00378D3C69